MESEGTPHINKNWNESATLNKSCSELGPRRRRNSADLNYQSPFSSPDELICSQSKCQLSSFDISPWPSAPGDREARCAWLSAQPIRAKQGGRSITYSEQERHFDHSNRWSLHPSPLLGYFTPFGLMLLPRNRWHVHEREDQALKLKKNNGS